MNTDNENTLNVLINFGGFYGYHDEYIQDQIFNLEIQSENVDYIQTYKNYAKEWLNFFNSECNLNLEYVGLESPSFYNFETDKIVAKIKRSEALTILTDYLNNKEFRDFADFRTTSRDGFISYYNGLTDLLRRSNTDDLDYSVLIGIVLDFAIIDKRVNEYIYDLEYEIEYENEVNE